MPDSTDHSRIGARRPVGTLFWYGTTVFLSSASLLVLEIVAGRILAPYIGVSLYTWTSIIGVILAGLSLGNWLGGRMADRGAGEVAVGVTLGIAAAACFAILALLMVVARPLQTMELSLLTTSFVYVAALFFLPAVLLGVVTPLLTTLALRLDMRTGHVVGRMHALAALGSITGTFATGYWLVQTVGSKTIIVYTAIALVIVGLPYLRGLRFSGKASVGVVALIAALVSVTQAVQGFVNPCLKESGYYCVRVVEHFSDAGEGRSLILDHLTHSTNIKQAPAVLVVPYVHAMDEIVHRHFSKPERLRYFFAGGGAYTHPRAVRHRYPLASVTVSELDPAVTEVATTELFFDPANIRVLHGDARVVLHSLRHQQFDAVVTDAFHDVAIPYHLTTIEYHELVKARLAPDGLYLINVVDVFPDPRLVKAMIKTLSGVFRHVDVWLERAPSIPTRLTYVLSATDKGPSPDRFEAERGEPRTWYNVTEILAATGTDLLDVPALSDDFAPVEGLISTLYLSAAGR